LRGWAWMAATSAAMTLWLSRRSRTNGQRHRSQIFVPFQKRLALRLMTCMAQNAIGTKKQ
jgi:hypothetical protein